MHVTPRLATWSGPQSVSSRLSTYVETVQEPTQSSQSGQIYAAERTVQTGSLTRVDQSLRAHLFEQQSQQSQTHMQYQFSTVVADEYVSKTGERFVIYSNFQVHQAQDISVAMQAYNAQMADYSSQDIGQDGDAGQSQQESELAIALSSATSHSQRQFIHVQQQTVREHYETTEEYEFDSKWSIAKRLLTDRSKSD